MKIGFESLGIPAVTLVTNEFIDRYMPSANGEYVKVYLYLLRHAGEEITAAGIADVLDLTEGDVKRALTRWEREGLIRTGNSGGPEEGAVPEAAETPAAVVKVSDAAAAGRTVPSVPEAASVSGAAAAVKTEEAAPAGAEAPGRKEEAEKAPRKPETEAVPAVLTAAAALSAAAVREPVPAAPEQGHPELRAEQKTPVPQPAAELPLAEIAEALADRSAAEKKEKTAAAEPLPERGHVDYTKLKSDVNFTDLLYVIQRYLGRIFSQIDIETVAYLYDNLGMPVDLLEHLAEQCAQRGKTSLRYFEKVAIDWNRKGIRTVEQAKESGSLYTSEIAAVMKSFGMNSREPGTGELKLIRKWYDVYGFTKEMVESACSRTLLRIQKPSFPYADRILTEWHEAGLRTLMDAEKFEEARAAQKGKNIPAKKQGAVQGGTKFSNFEQRDDDIDALGRQLMKQQLGRRSG